MGALLILNTGLSIIVALTLFGAMAGVMGPPKKCCYWYGCCHKKKKDNYDNKQVESEFSANIEMKRMNREKNEVDEVVEQENFIVDDANDNENNDEKEENYERIAD